MPTQFLIQKSANSYTCLDTDALLDYLTHSGWQRRAPNNDNLWCVAFDGAAIVADINGLITTEGAYAADVLCDMARPVSDIEIVCLSRAYTRLARYVAQQRQGVA